MIVVLSCVVVHRVDGYNCGVLWIVVHRVDGYNWVVALHSYLTVASRHDVHAGHALTRIQAGVCLLALALSFGSAHAPIVAALLRV